MPRQCSLMTTSGTLVKSATDHLDEVSMAAPVATAASDAARIEKAKRILNEGLANVGGRLVVQRDKS